MAEHAALITQLADDGRLIHCSPLTEPGDALTVAVRDGAVEIGPEPVADGGSHLAGYYLVRCRSRQEAIDIAARIPDARSHHVVIRALMPLAGVNDTVS
ncbi:YciI family protein [Nocardia sp. NPDC059180]|uniref:YciI family protein n=1 Tax=Nocardia sp. NPDC059180 TaxID=3346761 RepID=UPI003678CE5E